MKDSINLLAEIGQAPGTWGIFELLNTGKWGSWLRSAFQSIGIIGLLSLSLIFLIKFLLFGISKQMPHSQMYVQNKILFLSKAFLAIQLTVETKLSTSEAHS